MLLNFTNMYCFDTLKQIVATDLGEERLQVAVVTEFNFDALRLFALEDLDFSAEFAITSPLT